MRGGNRNALGTVNGRTTSHRHQPVTPAGVVQLCGRAHCCFGRVAGCLVKHGHRQSRQSVERFLQYASRAHSGIGDHQRACDANARAFLCKQLHGAKVKLDLGEVVDGCHGETGWGCGYDV